MNTRRISVIIPVYNAECYLIECLNSVISQTFKDIEIICIDDGSSDRSGEILDDYAGKDDRIKVIHQENGGPARARNVGLNLAKGEYVLFVDSDDTIRPELCEKAIVLADRENADVTCYFHYGMVRYPTYFETLKQVIHANHGYFDIEKQSFSQNTNFIFSSCLWAKLCRKSFIERNRLLFPEVFGEDTCFWVQILLKNPKLALLPERLYYYRENPTSLINNPEKEYGKDIVATFALLKKIISDAGCYRGIWRDIHLRHKLMSLYNRSLFFTNSTFANQLQREIALSLDEDDRNLIKSKSLPVHVRNFYLALDGNHIAYIKNLIFVHSWRFREALRSFMKARVKHKKQEQIL